MSAPAREEKSLSSNRAYAQNGKELDQLARKKQMADPGQEPAVQVRSDFRSTAFWQPDVVTGTDGKAFIKVKYPDSVTTWKAVARAASAGNQFGLGSETTRTQQPLIVRLQAPRFFVVGDRATVSAVINNNTDQPMSVTPSLNAEGLEVQQAKLPLRLRRGKPRRNPRQGSPRVLCPPWQGGLQGVVSRFESSSLLAFGGACLPTRLTRHRAHPTSCRSPRRLDCFRSETRQCQAEGHSPRGQVCRRHGERLHRL